MDANLPFYTCGEAVQVGDRVRYKGTVATVVFVIDGEGGTFAPGYADYQGYEPGLMLCDDDGTLNYLPEPDEELEFIAHES